MGRKCSSLPVVMQAMQALLVSILGMSAITKTSVFAFETCFTVCYADSYILYLEPVLAVGHGELQCTNSFPKDNAVGNNM